MYDLNGGEFVKVVPQARRGDVAPEQGRPLARPRLPWDVAPPEPRKDGNVVETKDKDVETALVNRSRPRSGCAVQVLLRKRLSRTRVARQLAGRRWRQPARELADTRV